MVAENAHLLLDLVHVVGRACVVSVAQEFARHRHDHVHQLVAPLVQLARRELGERERVSRCVRWRLVISELPLIINITKRFG